MDGTNWVTYTQNVFYPVNAAANATWAITDETRFMGSVKPMPCKLVRFVIEETGAEADITATLVTFKQ